MGQYNVSTNISFWSTDIVIGEVLAASDVKYFKLQGKTVASFEPRKRQSLEDFSNRYLLTAEDGKFIEFT